MPTRYSQQAASLMTRDFQQFDDVSLIPAQGINRTRFNDGRFRVTTEAKAEGATQGRFIFAGLGLFEPSLAGRGWPKAG